MPKLAVFPKAFMPALCKDGTMTVSEWIDLAVKLDIDGLEWYAGFLEMADESNWSRFRRQVGEHGKVIPMMCCSPDFTHPDAGFRAREVVKQKRWIDMTYALGGSYCRVLSGQRRPELSVEEGIRLAADCIHACLPYAQERGITLIIENHYKDDFWDYPEFAQKMDVFCELVARVDHPNFGVNYDPSNTYLAGEDPLELLQRVSHRVVTMHASDRYLIEGTIEDLRREEGGSQGYARRLRHGEIGKGLNDYDAIFTELKRVDFNGWISIEDGVDGMEQLARSVTFLRRKMAEYWSTEIEKQSSSSQSQMHEV
ncbi:sugar phosphate isomerase/epimerase [Nibrella saemangeumensis]|uniref:Sugar phosphate isomerase/epimerase n=1 Tax=Nibrella saemangeumensis TaxID=1084526 RepID=A0ABP8NQJ0_9BACT